MGKSSWRKEKLVSALGIPGDVGLGDAIVTVTGPHQAVVENYRRILCCTDRELILLTADGKMTIRGERLMLLYYTPEELLVCGKISCICLDS